MQLLQQILQRKLILWTEAGAAKRIVVARKRMSLANVPSGVELTYRKLEGTRVAARASSPTTITRRISAKWPEAGMHEAKDARLIWVVEGDVNFQAGHYLLGCNAGDLILIPPHLPYPGDKYLSQLIDSRTRACQLLWMLHYRHGFHCYLSYYKNGERKGSPSENWLFPGRQVNELFHLLLEEATGDKNEQLCHGLLLAFTTALHREVEEARYIHPGPMTKYDIAVAKTDFTGQLENYVTQHLAQPLTSERVANELYMSRSQFVRRIRQETGHTFVEFLNIYRIQQAKALLRESEWPVRAIAEYVGFKSSTYFHTFFKHQTGCTPGEFRLKT